MSEGKNKIQRNKLDAQNANEILCDRKFWGYGNKPFYLGSLDKVEVVVLIDLNSSPD